jgi:hypothetical protein
MEGLCLAYHWLCVIFYQITKRSPWFADQGERWANLARKRRRKKEKKE